MESTKPMNQVDNDEIEIDLKELFFVLTQKIWIIILVALAAVTISGLVTKFAITPQYESTSKLYIVSKSTSLTSLTDIQLGTSLTQDYMVMIKSRPVTEKVIKNLKLDLTHEELVDKIAVNNPTDTRILEITVTDPDPYLAQTIADEFADVGSTQMAKIMDQQAPNVVEDANFPEEQASPSLMKNVVIAGLLGILVSAGIIIVLHLMNESITSEDDVEKYLGLSTLGTIPVSENERGKSKHKKKIRSARAGGKK